jgi:hypothetical protein
MWDSDTGGAAAACGELEPAPVAAFVRRHTAVELGRVLLHVEPLRGGLEAAAVARVQAAAEAGQGTPHSCTFVVKRLDGRCQRELAVYQLLATTCAPAAPQLLGVQVVSPTRSYLFLEWIPAMRWPWADPAHVAHVLEQLAGVHAALPVSGLAGSLGAWDYESELLSLAGATLETLEAAVQTEALAGLREFTPVLRRVVAALPAMRQRLLSDPALGQAVLHGDLHSGNVLLRDGSAQPSVVLVDWGRARLGSPLEDISSWLESLGFWQPSVRQQRRALLGHYLQARGLPLGPGQELYLGYWMAAACNALAGALRYHLLETLESAHARSRRQMEAARAVHGYLRAIQLADVLCQQAVPPQVVVLVKGPHLAGPVRPVHDREAGIGGAEGLPARGADAAERAEDLADNASMRDDHDPFAGVRGGDGADRVQDAAAEVAVALATGPVEAIIGLPQVGLPEPRVAALHLDEWDTLEPTAVDLTQEVERSRH